MASKEIKIYVANLSEYNSGRTLGEWFELPCSFTDIQKKLRLDEPEYGEEWIILDYEAPFKIGEYDSIEKLNEYAEQLDNVADKIIENLDDATDFEKLEEILENGGENFRIYEEVENDADLGYAIVEEVYGSPAELPRETLERYFNYEAFGRDVNIESSGFFGKGCYVEYTE